MGAGLQDGVYYALLGATDHGGVTVRVQSNNPAVALVAPNASTPGSTYIDIPVASGSTAVSYYIQGMEGAAGQNTTITVSAQGFGSNSHTVNVVQPAVQIAGLNTSTTSLSPNDEFYAYIGIPSSNNTVIYDYQEIRVGGNPVTVTFTNSNDVVGRLVTNSGAGQSATVTIGVGQSNSPTTVAAGGVAFDPMDGGSSTVTASITGFISVNTVTVTVTQ
ncbi:MAG: hypothetical protein AB1553_08440 [Nitrospirota bacterium]